jgi:formylglycine-generating enzyme required for sulfatase activity
MRKQILSIVITFPLLLFSACNSETPILFTSTEIANPVSTTATSANELSHSGNKTRMSLIPAGIFSMGTDVEKAMVVCQNTMGICEPDSFSHEEPSHAVSLDAFWIDKTEVTNAMYAECVEAGICPLPEHPEYHFNDPAQIDHPVMEVSWYDAETYCKWIGARLPTEAEWEYAARGGLEGAYYPWGDTPPVCKKGTGNGANSSYCGLEDSLPVGSFAPNGYGLYDMAGNVWEWVADWDGDYNLLSPINNPIGPEKGTHRVLRGGSWDFDPIDMGVSARIGDVPTSHGYDAGFRCANNEIVP